MKIETNKYSTASLDLATALVCRQHQLVRLNFLVPKRATFVFDDSEKLRADVEAFYNDQLTISAKTYFNNLRDLKSRIYGGLE